ncbi:MAG: HAMP domain-containing sensor histidine kinase [Candidatus Paceibacterota bacterium]|jgi:signal transduction histidine kinase
MIFNYITNIQGCLQALQEQIPVVLVYYSHLPVILISIFFALFILIKNKKDILSRYFSTMVIIFVVWVIIDLITWIMCYNGSLTMFVWSVMELLEVSFFFLSFNFTYIFFFNKKISLGTNLILLIPILPIFYFTVMGMVLQNYDTILCQANENSNVINRFVPFADIFYMCLIIYSYIVSFFKILRQNRLKNTIFFIGIAFFLAFYFAVLYISDYVESYNWSLIALAGMPIFLAVIAYIIVKFKAFDIKLLATQALVWSLIIIIGSEFFFIQSDVNRILTALTLVISGWLGLVIIRSVKKEVALREELEIANNNQTSLIHFISHQLKGFFTKSKMIFAGILEDDFEKSSDTLKAVAKEGLLSDNNAVTMIQDILGASNYKKGTVAYNLKDVDLSLVVKDVCANFAKELADKGLTLKTNISDTPVVVLADQIQITQVFKNLIDNSIKYTPSGGLTISLKAVMVEGKKRAVFEVSDTGIGFTEKDKTKLFTEGGKGEDSLKYNVNSTGYGLYIVKKIVENHAGKIWAESDGRGKGARFFVALPVK